jgi:mono/diheme cytochrome c family protein
MKRIAVALFAGLAVADAVAGERMSYGEAEYLNSCAVCHGIEGKGDGPLEDLLIKRPSDLTSISKRNGGRFPYARVFAAIDGRVSVPSHGNRDMPIWGRQFLEDDQQLYGPAGGEIVTTERIHELTSYIQSLQR